MSNAQKLKDAIGEYRKANKNLDAQLTKIEEDNRRTRKAAEVESSHRT
ncbi:hypothetical protein ES703_78890 [subsurface metagenome]